MILALQVCTAVPDGVVVNAQSLSIPDNGSSMPIVYLAQSGNQPWSNVAFGGGTISSNSILRELSAGHPVSMSCKPSEFASTGHFIVLTGLSNDGYVLVNAPNAAHAAYSYKKYPVSYLVSCGKGWWSFP